MVFIGAGVQNRLFATAKRCFGPDGEAVVRAAAQQAFERPVDQLTYAQIPELLATVERTAQLQVGHEVAHALAEALDQLQARVDAGLSGRLVGVLTRRVGSAAEPLLRATCTQLGFLLETVSPSQLPELAEAMHKTTVALFGGEMADSLRVSVLDAARARLAGLTPQILALAREHLGDNGDTIIQRLCREQLEIALDDLDAGSVRALAMAVETYGPVMIGTVLATAFVSDASQALASPADSLRHRIVEVTRNAVGPLAPEFLEEVCAQHGLPFQAVDYEHLMWLAEVLRAETEPLAGKEAADGLARELRAFLTGRR